MMENKKLKIIIKLPYKDLTIDTVNDNLKDFQNIVGGYIETLDFPNVPDAVMVFDEEGKMKGLQGNFFIPHYEDCIVGNCFIVGCDHDGNFIDLTDKQIKQIEHYINTFALQEPYDLYNDFEILNNLVKQKMKSYDEEL